MSMWNVRVCVGCLATDARMYSMSASGLLQPYQLLIGVQIDDINVNKMPKKLCWECAALVNKFNTFRHKCERAHLLLRDIYTQHQEVAEYLIKSINRTQHNFCSSLTISNETKPIVCDETRCKADDSDTAHTQQKSVDVNSSFINNERSQDLELLSHDSSDDVALPKIARRRKQFKGKNVKKNKARSKRSAVDFEVDEIVLTQEEQMETVRDRKNARGFSTARFKCELCYKTFNEQKTHSNHLRLHDPVSGDLQCDICKLRYNTRLKIFKHITNNHMRKYACRLCTHVCYNRSFALNHYRWHQGVVYECEICGAKFDKKTSHRSHLRLKHPSEHVCGECAEPFVSLSGLQQHASRMHANGGALTDTAAGPYCSACDVQFKCQKAWTRHILISPKHEHEKATIKNGCQYCGDRADSSAGLRRHYIEQHRRHKRSFKLSPNKRFPVKCSQCEDIVLSAGEYWQHFRQKHPGKQFPLTRSSFICEYCGNWFKYKSALDAHKRTHVERYRCDKCNKEFARLGSLVAHAGTHEGHFVCDVCDRQFAYKRSLTNHFRTHSVERPHVCEWCGKNFAFDCNLRKHELAVHGAVIATSSAL